MPIHPLWQIRQVVCVNSALHVSWITIFGNTVLGKLFASFMGLVLWIAISIKHIMDLLTYVDNTFSYNHTNNVAWYKPYNTMMPAQQVVLLSLWDKLSIPHNHKKQMLGVLLPIIGFSITISTLRVTVPDRSCLDSITAIQAFVHAPPSGHRCHLLRGLQLLVGWINWALNTYPLLRPGLLAIYSKMSDKIRAHTR